MRRTLWRFAVRYCLTVLTFRVAPPLYTHKAKNQDSRRLLLESVFLWCDGIYPQGEWKRNTDLAYYSRVTGGNEAEQGVFEFQTF